MSLLLEAINDQGNPPPITSCFGDALQIVEMSVERLELIKQDSSLNEQEVRHRVRGIIRTTIKALAYWAKLSDVELYKDITYEKVDKI